MKISHNIASASLLLSIQSASAFRTTTQTTPLRIQSIDKSEILKRLGLSSTNEASTKSRVRYNLQNEHQVFCPLTNSHQGILCTTSSSECSSAESIADNHDLVSQVISCGSLAASIRNRDRNGDSLYFLPFVITLVESYMADELSAMLMDEIISRDFVTSVECKDCSLTSSLVHDMIFNSAGLETNEILLDLSDYDNVMLYACNTHMDEKSATSDVYLIPAAGKKKKDAKVWRFTVEYKVATINLSQIRSFGQGESTMPLRPDVWLKDDYF
ncbi:hypothetical protein ACHAWO_000728 [Cyclotella atomus]|uniref:Uncharacterized protein n=1 Tax=Cyclotella atomus TaxID=382360 RepID=A0ABD3PFW9_9STRA